MNNQVENIESFTSQREGDILRAEKWLCQLLEEEHHYYRRKKSFTRIAKETGIPGRRINELAFKLRESVIKKKIKLQKMYKNKHKKKKKNVDSM